MLLRTDRKVVEVVVGHRVGFGPDRQDRTSIAFPAGVFLDFSSLASGRAVSLKRVAVDLGDLGRMKKTVSNVAGRRVTWKQLTGKEPAEAA